jgi:F-type H+-transporting ATPase subunit b
MQIDLFTLAAQIANFMILVLLLRHFLYSRIVRAMDERQQRISDRLEEARDKREQAEKEKTEYRRKREDLDDKREEILSDARQEAARRREQLEEEAREEVGRMKERWQSALERDRQSFLRNLRESAGREFNILAGRALKDLADRDLEDQIVGVFTERLEDLDTAGRDRLIEAAREDEGTLSVRTSFELPPGGRRKVTSSVHRNLADDLETEFSIRDDLICGIELAAGGVKVAWSVDTHLNRLEQRLAELLESKSDRARGGDKENGSMEESE